MRLELGPKDLSKQSARIVRRDKKSDEEGASLDIPWPDLSTAVPKLLEAVQQNLFQKAKEKLDQGIEKVLTFDEVLPALNRKHLILAPWCEDPESEEEIKKETQRLSEIQVTKEGLENEIHTRRKKARKERKEEKEGKERKKETTQTYVSWRMTHKRLGVV